MIYRCNDCKEIFDTPDSESICLEDYNGVSDIFYRRSWITIDICPCCGSSEVEEIAECEVYKCKDCPRLGDDCEGDDDYIEERSEA